MMPLARGRPDSAWKEQHQGPALSDGSKDMSSAPEVVLWVWVSLILFSFSFHWEDF